MQIAVRFLGLEGSGPLRYHIVRRTYFQLRRHEHEIAEAVVRVKDVNGPRKGVDTRCQIMITGPRLGRITVEHDGLDASTAVDLALGRVAQAIRRKIARNNEVHRRASPLIPIDRAPAGAALAPIHARAEPRPVELP